LYLHKRDVITERASHYQLHPGNWQFLQPFFSYDCFSQQQDDCLTGIVPGRLDKGGIAAIPGDPFACICLSEFFYRVKKYKNNLGFPTRITTRLTLTGNYNS